jgi:hypothetical protein
MIVVELSVLADHLVEVGGGFCACLGLSKKVRRGGLVTVDGDERSDVIQ